MRYYVKKNKLSNMFCDFGRKFVDMVKNTLKNINKFTMNINLKETIVLVFIFGLLLAAYIVLILYRNRESIVNNIFFSFLFVLPITMLASFILLILSSFIINNVFKNVVFGTLHLFTLITFFVSFILLCIMVLPAIGFISVLQYRNNDKRFIYYLKRFVKALISWLLVIILFIGNIIKGLDMGYKVNAQDIFLIFVVIYICIPIFTSDILRWYESKKEAFKDQSIVLLVVAILFNVFCFMTRIDVGQDLEKCSILYLGFLH